MIICVHRWRINEPTYDGSHYAMGVCQMCGAEKEHRISEPEARDFSIRGAKFKGKLSRPPGYFS